MNIHNINVTYIYEAICIWMKVVRLGFNVNKRNTKKRTKSGYLSKSLQVNTLSYTSSAS